jgi:hypothetical protein
MIPVVIVVAVIVAPRPILFLFFWAKPAEVAIAIAVRLLSPTAIVHNFIVVPHVIVGVIRVVDAIVVMLACDSGRR